MKKLFIYFTILLYLLSNMPLQTYAAPTHSAEISKIENDLYGFDYINDELKNRVARLEKTIYGQASTGDLNKRIKKLATDITAEQIGLEITPSEDTFREDDVVADNTVNYPIVDEIEMKLFNQTYKNRDFHTRIVTIERKLFGKIYDIEDYSTRMDRIKAEVMPQTLARENNDYYDDNAISSSSLSGLNSNRFSSMPYGQGNYTRPYANYGDFTGGAFPTPESLDDELAQLEYNTFGTEFSHEDTKKRLKRLNSVNKAKRTSSRYDSNKFQQRMSTAMEIGAMLLMILAMVL
ncbi:MAG: hypothetical protein NC408_08420 [Candidatus Gastranaerophilales bacterium]|nr:hypothetical protein [Candidatus Gastranaerophilales bacterium]MCM1073905.1 hypothetical protein [Bacteroides sp.]